MRRTRTQNNQSNEHRSTFLESAQGDLPKFAANNRLQGTVGEYEAVARESLSYFGRYRIAGEKDGIVELLVEGATFPN
ncbi:MAG: lipocalin-like domain-containing protein [Deltaproteobacteria bacterium]